MRILLQRVLKASVAVNGTITGAIGRGFVVFLGVGPEDSEKDADYLADKCVNLRVFDDDAGKMNLSALDSGGEILVISQFTLYGDCRKGRRPSFTEAAPPERAKALYMKFMDLLRQRGMKVEGSEFGAKMLVEIWNDGPVTFMIESR